jgi:hypothetical protein
MLKEFHHSCGPDPSKQQMVMTRGGKMQPSITHMQPHTDVEDIAEVLRAGDLDNASLRTMLKEGLPSTPIPMNNQFLSNFRNRCLGFIGLHNKSSKEHHSCRDDYLLPRHKSLYELLSCRDDSSCPRPQLMDPCIGKAIR